jgi:hypothetical protein
MNKEEFLSIAANYYQEYESLKDSPNFYDYEKSFVEMWQRLGKEYMEKQLNESSATLDRRKKNANPLRRNLRIKVPQLP